MFTTGAPANPAASAALAAKHGVLLGVDREARAIQLFVSRASADVHFDVASPVAASVIRYALALAPVIAAAAILVGVVAVHGSQMLQPLRLGELQRRDAVVLGIFERDANLETEAGNDDQE